ncbi:MAG: 3-hydroxyacyl-ACP dehydratase FabZ [Firmicutes bacterium]|nr:3-hydroxyacyl-ACP dehydratase FabZ [Bacillota bacterium]
MDREKIKTILPHRDDMLLLDEVLKEGDIAHGFYKVRGDEFFLRGHFPGNPVVPGVILCEILAQTACVLLEDTIKDKDLPIYTGLDKVRFRNPVRPGDTIETKCSIKRAKHPFYFAKGTVEVNGKICVSAEFSFALTGV